jgi:ketosteroid isomerase-like protein
MVEGLEAIKAFWKQAAAALEVTSIQLRTVELEHLGDTAIEIGRATIATKSASLEVKYVVVWKQEGGSWKWHIDIWNPVS